jgi:hypothetical protein
LTKFGQWLLSKFGYSFSLRRGGTPSPLSTSLRAFPEPRPRASAFQLFNLSTLLFILSRYGAAGRRRPTSLRALSAFQHFSFSAFSQKTPTP